MNWLDGLKQKGVVLDTKRPPRPAEMESMNAIYKEAQNRAAALMKQSKRRQRER